MSPPHEESEVFERQQHVNRYRVLVIFFICLGSAAYGYSGSIIATTLTQPSFVAHMKLDTATNASALTGAMNGLYYAGGVIGSFAAGWLSKKYGRRLTTAIGDALLVITGACLTASVNPAMFIVFRFFSGLGAFTILSTVPLWVAELATPRLRGVCVDIHAVFMMIGYTAASYMGLGFYFVSGSNQWRPPIALHMVLPVISLCGLYWMPESPRWLLSQDRTEEAWGVVSRLHSSPHDPDHEFAKREFYQMRKQIELDDSLAVTYLDIFKKPSLRKRAIITIFLEFALMSAGILVVLNYGSIIWKNLGFDTPQILCFQSGWQLTGFVFNLVAMLFVDRVPRNRLICIGLMTCSLTMAVEMALQKYYLDTTKHGGLTAAAAMMFLFQTLFSLFLDGPTYFYLAEIWPSHLRSQGFALGIATLSLVNLMWLQAAPHAFTTIGWKFYLFFVIISGLSSIVVYFFFPDTLHKPLEEIAAMFGDEDKVAVYQIELDRDATLMKAVETELTDKAAPSQVGEVEEIEHRV